MFYGLTTHSVWKPLSWGDSVTPVQINVHMIFIIAAQIGSLNIFIYLFKGKRGQKLLEYSVTFWQEAGIA